MAYFDCIVGGSGKGNTLVVTCADDLAGATITCTNGTKTYNKTCPSTSPYEVTFYGLVAGTWTVSATVSGNTYTTTVVITDYEAELGGFNWKTWVDLSENYISSDFTDLDDLLSDETAIRELMTIHACVDYLAGIAATSADVEKIIENDYCAKWINNRDYALDTLYANEIIADYMDEADKYFYGEWVITDNTTTPPTWGAKGNVPIMTSNTAPYGEVSASSVLSTNYAYKAFDGDDTTGWHSTGVPAWISYKFTNPICVRKAVLITTIVGGPKVSKIQGSNDGSNWTDITDFVDCPAPQTTYSKEFDNTTYYLYLRLYVTESNYIYNNNQYANIAELQFYGRELSVSVPKMDTNTTPYGEASASTEYSISYAAWKAFDNDNSSAWISSSLSNPYLQYAFTHKVKLKQFRVVNNNESVTGYFVTSFKIQGSNTGNANDWHDVTTNISREQTKNLDVLYSVDDYATSDKNAYSMFRLAVLGGGTNNQVLIATLQFYGEDYSEKEFEEGTTKKWLYDHGVELETLSDVAGASAIYNHGPSSILEKQTNSSQGASVYTELDLTPYDLMRVKISQRFVGSGNKIRVLNTAQTSVIANDTISDLPYNTGLDISTCDATYAIDVLALGVSEIEFNEWWLE